MATEAPKNDNQPLPNNIISLYERLGGDPAVSATVTKMYEKILNDDLLKGYFANVDMGKHIKMQKKFLTLVFQNTELNKFTKQSMQKSHKKLNLKDVHFDRIKCIIEESMLSLNVSKPLVAETVDIAEKFRNYIVIKEVPAIRRLSVFEE
jgi:hemoglobin